MNAAGSELSGPRFLAILLALILAATSCAQPARRPGGAAPGSERTTTTTGVAVETSTPTTMASFHGEEADMPTPEDRDLVEAFLEFARSPGDTTPLSLAERVWLGLGTELLANRHRDELVDPDAWVVEVEHYAGYVGPFSALEVLSHGGEVEVSIGPHPHCASPPQPAPGAVADLRRVSVQPAGIESCLQWWTVDLFVSGAVEVEAVMLDLWEP